jgi:hypothetical protein
MGSLRISHLFFSVAFNASLTFSHFLSGGIMRKRKFDAIRTINRALDRGIDRIGRIGTPRRSRRGRSFFDIFMGEITGAPRRR